MNQRRGPRMAMRLRKPNMASIPPMKSPIARKARMSAGVPFCEKGELFVSLELLGELAALLVEDALPVDEGTLVDDDGDGEPSAMAAVGTDNRVFGRALPRDRSVHTGSPKWQVT